MPRIHPAQQAGQKGHQTEIQRSQVLPPELWSHPSSGLSHGPSQAAGGWGDRGCLWGPLTLGLGPGRRRPLCSPGGGPPAGTPAHARGKRFAAGSSEGRPGRGRAQPARGGAAPGLGGPGRPLGRAVRGCHLGGGPVRRTASSGWERELALKPAGPAPLPVQGKNRGKQQPWKSSSSAWRLKQTGG